jgi:hypothetical protein
MKKLIFILLLLPCFASAQINWNQVFGKQRFQQGLGLPAADTNNFKTAVDTSAFLLQRSDSSLYYRYKGWWKKVGGSGGTQNLQSVLNVGGISYNKTLSIYDTSSSSLYPTSVVIQGVNSGGPARISMGQYGQFTTADYTSQLIQMGGNATYGGSGKAMSIGSDGTNYSVGWANYGSANIHSLRSNMIQTAAVTTYIPAVNGTLVVSVNGQTPNTSGAVVTITEYTATLDFPNVTSSSISDLTLTATGVTIGQVVAVTTRDPANIPQGVFYAFVSANNVITCRFLNHGTGAQNPVSQDYVFKVFK